MFWKTPDVEEIELECESIQSVNKQYEKAPCIMLVAVKDYEDIAG